MTIEIIDTGSKGHVKNNVGLARWRGCDKTGNSAPSSSYCYRIGTWNVRSLYQPGKLANVAQEMIRMNVDVPGVAETFWDGVGDFRTSLPTVEDDLRVIYSGGDVKRRGVAFIIRGSAKSAIR